MNEFVKTFDLEVVTSRTPAEFVRLLFERIDVETHIQQYEDIAEIRTENFEISAFAGAQDAISSELNITPAVFIEFRPLPQLPTQIIAIKRLIVAIDKWLHFIHNDFALIYNGSIVMMYRKDKQLYVNDLCQIWNEHRLGLLTYPYEKVQIADIRTEIH